MYSSGQCVSYYIIFASYVLNISSEFRNKCQMPLLSSRAWFSCFHNAEGKGFVVCEYYKLPTLQEIIELFHSLLLSFAAFVSSSLSADESVRPDKDACCLRH